MRTRRLCVLGLASALILVCLCGCSVGRAAKEGGGGGCGGAGGGAAMWWAEEGKGQAQLLAESAAGAAKEKLQEKLDAYKGELGKKVDDGTASATETAMYWALGGGGGAAGIAGLLFGRGRAAVSGAAVAANTPTYPRT